MIFEQRTEEYFHITSWQNVAAESRMATTWEHSTAQAYVETPEHLNFVAKDFVALGFLPAFARRVAQQKIAAQRAKEEAFEAVRIAHFPTAPSRRDAMFLCESARELAQHLRAYGFPVAGRNVIS